jgi:palmitoyltransferase
VARPRSSRTTTVSSRRRQRRRGSYVHPSPTPTHTQIYLNPFDLGKRRNLENFFNIGPNGYSKLTLLFPLVVPPYTNGWSYPRRSLPELGPDHAPLLQHAEDRQGEPNPEWIAQQQAQQQAMGHNFGPGDGPGGLYVMGGGDDLTDDEGGGGGWWNEDENEPHHAGTAQV